MTRKTVLLTRLLLFSAVCAALLAGGGAYAQKSGGKAKSSGAVDRQRAKVESFRRDLEECKRRMKQIAASKSSASKQIDELRTQMNLRNGLIRETQAEASLLRREIETNDSLVTVLGGELQRNRELYAEMVREAWRNYRQNNYTTYLFSSDGVGDAVRRAANIRRIAELRAQRASQIEQEEQELAEYRAVLNRRKHELDSVEISLASQRNALQGDISELRRKIGSLSAKEKKTIAERNDKQKRLDGAIAELQRLTPVSYTHLRAHDFSAKTSNLNLPVVGGSVSRYRNNMADIKGKPGAKVVTIYDGKVVRVEKDITNHYSVFVAHGGYISTYVHLSDVCVAYGDKITRNQQIGTIGIGIDDNGRESAFMHFAIYDRTGAKMSAANCFKK